ncbi:hypothetical protein [Patulibacter defluvii]|uniref:hypothetical protein n=1 Tax=Patulibacter defluvii TaxID=3095358 RepID=UPI002A74B95F|nr:hypothetical protein [Patulibacter sp. DM4]
MTALDPTFHAVAAMVTVLAHHLSGPLALAFALPPILVVGGAVLFLRRRAGDEDEEFDWADDEPEPSAPLSPSGRQATGT